MLPARFFSIASGLRRIREVSEAMVGTKAERARWVKEGMLRMSEKLGVV